MREFPPIKQGIASSDESQSPVETFPATPGQAWYWQRVEQDSLDPVLNVAFCRRLTGSISDRAIGAALDQLEKRHEILRTRFSRNAANEVIQEVYPPSGIKLDLVDLRHLPSDEREAARQRLARSAARTPFACIEGRTVGPLFRALLLRTAAQEAYLHLTLHHLIMDGWSFDLVMREFGELAAGFDAGRIEELEPVSLHFGDFARWQVDSLESGALEAERRYWENRLADLPHFSLPKARPGSSWGAETAMASIMLPRGLTDAVEDLARRTNHTMFSMAASFAAAALHSETGSPEIVMGTQFACRNDPDSEAIIGPVMNTAILRVPVQPDQPFQKLADEVRNIAREAMAHQNLPLPIAAAAIEQRRGTAIGAPYNVNLVVQRTYIASASVKDRTYGSFRIESVAAPAVGGQWDIGLLFVEREKGWRLSCEYAPALYDASSIESLIEAIKGAMEHAVANQLCSTDLAAAEPESGPAHHSGGMTALTPAPNPRLQALAKRILPLQTEGNGAPIIALNNASVYYPIARAIGDDHPFYDVQIRPCDGPVRLPRRHFLDHARDAVEMIRLARPHGPYILFGHCVLGALALEAARILQEEGETVEFVAIADTYRPGFRERLGFIDRNLRAWQVRWLTTASLYRRVRSGELCWSQFADNYRLMRKFGFSRLVAQLEGNGTSPAPDAMNDSGRWFPETVLMPSQAGLELQPYKGRVILFRSADLHEGRYFPHDFGWTGFIEGQFEVVTCPGTHDTMFREADVIAKAIRRMADNKH